MSKLTQSKSKFDFFKADWVNVHLMGGAKIFGIYLLNYRYVADYDPKVLFILITVLYAGLLFISSDMFMSRVFNIQQGVFTIAKGLDNWFVGSLDGDTPA